MHPLDANGHLPQGLEFRSKVQLVKALRWWLTASGANHLGDKGRQGRQPWLYATISGHRVRLNADTTREAIQAVVALHDKDPLTRWYVVKSEEDRFSKVVVSDRKNRLKGWNVYLTKAISEESMI